MINFNGEIKESEIQLSVFNRSFLYGDGVFETIKVVNNTILFLEEHYFRLMSSMRIIRMEIPMSFTMEFLENQILDLVQKMNIQDSARVRLTIFRNEGGFYTPLTNTVSYVIQASELEDKEYKIKKTSLEVDLFKDFVITNQLLSTLKTTNKLVQVTASIFASENKLDSCLLINEEKNVIEAVNGNLFMIIGNKIITPSIMQGCINGVMRKQIIKLIEKMDSFEIEEKSISPFDLQKSDELFITNVIMGIQPITKYRKKDFKQDVSQYLLSELNKSLNLV